MRDRWLLLMAKRRINSSAELHYWSFHPLFWHVR